MITKMSFYRSEHWQPTLLLYIVSITTVTLLLLLTFAPNPAQALPVPNNDRGTDYMSGAPKPPEPERRCTGNVCGDKGKFCELICKNNPSEGGKMCK